MPTNSEYVVTTHPMCGTQRVLFNMPDPQYWSLEKQRSTTNRLLRQHVHLLAARSSFYQRRFAAAGFDAASFRGDEDLLRLPLTSKADIASDPSALTCVTPEEIVDICLTSGTTAQPVAIAQSRADLERLARNEEGALRIAGLTSVDRVLCAAAIDRCFMAGLAYFLGLLRIGATTMRCGGSHPTALAKLIRDYAPSAVIGVPSVLLASAARLRADGLEPSACGVSRFICIGEPIRRADLGLNALGKSLADAYGAEVYGTYASTELATAFAECSAGAGGHVQPDLVFVEILDSDGRRVGAGQAGEVVATPLRVNAMPLLRMQTGDIAILDESPCRCGRNTPRLGPILGRKNQMLKVRGTTLYPSAISDVLHGLGCVVNYYIEVRQDFELSDRIRIVVGVHEPSAIDPTWLAERVVAAIRIRPDIHVQSHRDVEEKTSIPGKRKAVTFFDYR